MSSVKQKTEKPYPTGKLIARLLKDLKPIAWAIILAAVVCCVSVGLGLLGPEIVGNLSDILYAFGDGQPLQWREIVRLSLELLGVYCASAGCSMLTVLFMNNITSRFYTCGMRLRISEKLNRLPVSFYDNMPNGELLSRMMNDVGNMSSSIHVIIDLFIRSVLEIVAITVILFRIHALMATAVLVLVPLSIFISTYVAGKGEKYWHQFRKVNGRLYSFVEEDFGGFDTVKAFNLEERQKNIDDEITGEYAAKVEKGWFVSGLVQPIIAFTDNIAYVAVCVIGGLLIIDGNIGVGDMVKVILFAKMFAGPLESIAGGMSSIHRTLACAARVYALLDEKEMDTDNEATLPQNGAIDIRDVNFSYVKDKPLIRHFDLHVEEGQKIALVGPTGGGKTTIVNLLMRFYDIDSGEIDFGGTNIMKTDRAELRSRFAMVLQDTWLFSGTIFDNIAYGKENATREEVENAAKQAHIDHFIRTLPEGYDTVINEESANISSGQKQLLTIARAYLADRKMLILDEATSNVDTRTELLIQKTMDELMKGRTSFVIAHRLSTIVNADVILVINEGQVVEQGTHAELMAKNGFYTEIYNSQYDLLK